MYAKYISAVVLSLVLVVLLAGQAAGVEGGHVGSVIFDQSYRDDLMVGYTSALVDRAEWTRFYLDNYTINCTGGLLDKDKTVVVTLNLLTSDTNLHLIDDAFDICQRVLNRYPLFYSCTVSMASDGRLIASVTVYSRRGS